MENNAKVLIVDDEKEIAVIFAFLLTQHGFQTDMANNGEEALKKFKEQRFDFVVSDVRMPKMNGGELFNKTHELYENPPKFLFITGYEDILGQDILNKSLAKFSKPVDHGAIVDKLLESMKSDPVDPTEEWILKRSS